MIGSCVHHHGNGHLRRAVNIAAHCEQLVTGPSSRPAPTGCTGDRAQLPRDDLGTGDRGRANANNRLHRAPLQDRGLRQRMARIAGWIDAPAPGLLVSDASVEVAAPARWLGIPVAGVAMRGLRGDPAHLLGRDLADALPAPWPDDLPEPQWPGHRPAKTVHTRRVLPPRRPSPRRSPPRRRP